MLVADDKGNGLFCYNYHELYDGVNYMKKNLIEVGKALVTMILIIAIIWLALKQYNTVWAVVVCLIVWLQVSYNIYQTVKLNLAHLFSFNATAMNKNKSEDNKNKTEEQDLKPNELLAIFNFTNNIECYEGTNELGMTFFGDFSNLVQQLKSMNYDYHNDTNYQTDFKMYSQSIATNLKNELVSIYGNRIKKYFKIIDKAIKRQPYSKETLMALRDEIISKYGENSQCTLAIEKATKNLDLIC